MARGRAVLRKGCRKRLATLIFPAMDPWRLVRHLDDDAFGIPAGRPAARSPKAAGNKLPQRRAGLEMRGRVQILEKSRWNSIIFHRDLWPQVAGAPSSVGFNPASVRSSARVLIARGAAFSHGAIAGAIEIRPIGVSTERPCAAAKRQRTASSNWASLMPPLSPPVGSARACVRTLSNGRERSIRILFTHPSYGALRFRLRL